MKKIITIIVLLLPILIIAQDKKTDCKVLMEELQGSFRGDCKKGLAHGNGIAQGTDTYDGNFKKGLPNGQGKYIWSTGEIYEGKWLKGKRIGYGTYFFRNEFNEDCFIEGYWKDDVYVGKTINEKEFTVERVRNLDKVRVKYRSTGNTIVVKYLRGSANTLYSIPDLKYAFSSGTEISGANISGFENVEFPFRFKLDFTAPGKFVRRVGAETMSNVDATDILREAEIKIDKPGNWVVTVTY